jgi:hypothetical protein
MMVALLLYGYAIGERSSRRLERRCVEDAATRVICANQAPDHTTIARFRQRHERALAGLFGEVLALCADAGLGSSRDDRRRQTKVAANAAPQATRDYEQREAGSTLWLSRCPLRSVSRASRWRLSSARLSLTRSATRRPAFVAASASPSGPAVCLTDGKWLHEASAGTDVAVRDLCPPRRSTATRALRATRLLADPQSTRAGDRRVSRLIQRSAPARVTRRPHPAEFEAQHAFGAGHPPQPSRFDNQQSLCPRNPPPNRTPAPT